jgi:hypothetical protein
MSSNSGSGGGGSDPNILKTSKERTDSYNQIAI